MHRFVTALVSVVLMLRAGSAHAENPTGATRLYESVGMAVESTSATYEKAIA